MKKVLLVVGFLAGVAIAATANLQLTVGAVLIAVTYSEFRKTGVTIDTLDDEILAELKKLLNRE